MTDPDKYVVDVTGFSRPATKLIEKVSNAVGGLFKPHQIRRVAKAEAEAEVIRAEAAVEATDLQRRALQRFMREQATKQRNMESITHKALPGVEAEAQPEDIEDDWIANFFDRARLISDEEVQDIWAKLLAGQANRPGGYSRRTVNSLFSLSKTDARLFTSLSSFVVESGRKIPLIYDYTADIYQSAGLTLERLGDLASMGLINEKAAGFVSTGEFESLSMTYFGKDLKISIPGGENATFDMGKVLFTSIGEELADLCNPDPKSGFLNYLKSKWTEKGYEIMVWPDDI